MLFAGNLLKTTKFEVYLKDIATYLLFGLERLSGWLLCSSFEVYKYKYGN